MSKLIDSTHLHIDGDWSLLRKLCISPRVKLLLWRPCRNCLPTGTELQKKGVFRPSVCILCNRDLENTCHLFLTCPSSISCWEEPVLLNSINFALPHADSFKDFCLKMLSPLSSEDRDRFATALWSIWRGSNDKLWNNIDSSSSHCLPCFLVLKWMFADEASILSHDLFSSTAAEQRLIGTS